MGPLTWRCFRPFLGGFFVAGVFTYLIRISVIFGKFLQTLITLSARVGGAWGDTRGGGIGSIVKGINNKPALPN